MEQKTATSSAHKKHFQIESDLAFFERQDLKNDEQNVYFMSSSECPFLWKQRHTSSSSFMEARS